jgi:hypothetical protein
MNKLNLQESEKNRILLMHRVIKEQSSPVTGTPAAPEIPVAPKAPTPDAPKSIEEQLTVFITNGCAKNGKVVKMRSTSPEKQFAIKQESTKTPGKFRYLFIDNTVGMTDETGKFQILPNKWACSAAAIEAKTASETQKTAFITNAKSVGYLETLTPEQKASGLYKKYKVPGSTEFFPPNGIEMFFDPTSVRGSGTKTTTTNIKTDTESNIPDNIKDCKVNIEMYYTTFTKKRPISQVNFDVLKNKVQACKNEFYGDWGILRGGRRMDKMLDFMSGGIGGPSRRGEDSKWRLN